jgi:hypothetical protein
MYFSLYFLHVKAVEPRDIVWLFLPLPASSSSRRKASRSPLTSSSCPARARPYAFIFISTSKLRGAAHTCLRPGVGDHAIPSSFIFSSTCLAISCIPLAVGWSGAGPPPNIENSGPLTHGSSDSIPCVSLTCVREM